ncbi:MAG: Type 1 glutamine amidotransferase-like domain-containing protein [Erysipelotrichaceae bacterium]|nr:Type 1 glutamine amidotransferase-like domain-containing protein [Erysipelotrichaceae bacterium]
MGLWLHGKYPFFRYEGILPLSYSEGWITDGEEWKESYGKGTDGYEELVRPFRSFGIKDPQISWVNYYEDDEASASRKIREADVLFFTGGYPDWMLQRLYDLGITEEVRNFDGVMMGTSAGAMIQLDTFHLTPEEDYEYQYYEGLALLGGFDIEVHYEEDLRHIEAIIRTLEDTGNPVIVLPNEGGAIIGDNMFELLGEAFVLETNDLDELYQAYDTLRSYGFEY